MEIEDLFEEWEGSDLDEIDIDIEGLKLNEEQSSESEKDESSGDEEAGEVNVLRCKKCRKVYRKKAWFQKHLSNCDGTATGQNCRKRKKMSQHQIKTREVLANLEVDEYFSTNGLRVVSNTFEAICETSADTTVVRGARYADMKVQADGISSQLKSKNTLPSAESFLRYVTAELWKITFARDSQLSCSVRQGYVAQHLNAFRSSPMLLDRGGLSVVNSPTYDFFCLLEVSIRPFLNLANFRSSTRKSDKELLEQLVDNTPELLEIFPYSDLLSCEDRMLLLKLFCNLFYRARKWAYLKVYKEQAKVSQLLNVSSSKSGSVDLHGKDSIRKALLCNTIHVNVNSS